MRGVYLNRDISRGTKIIKIPKKLIMSCDMGRDCELSRSLREQNVDFEKFKHVYFANFLLEDMENENSFYKPYYDTLPEDISNIPIIWTNHEINQLHGSYFVRVIVLSYSRSRSASARASWRSTATTRKCATWTRSSAATPSTNTSASVC